MRCVATYLRLSKGTTLAFSRSLFWAMASLILINSVQAQTQAIPVFVAKTKTDHFVDRIEALGTLRANETVTISSAVTETITAIHFDDGQRVKSGDILVEMTSKEEHAQLEEAQSTLAEANKQYARAQDLSASGTISESSLDERRREYQTAKARLNAIQSRLQDRLVEAPFDGIVGIRRISKGALVTPGDRITTLDDDSVMKLDFSVPSTFLSSLEPGIHILAKAPALNNREFSGVISSIDSQIDTVTRSVLVRARLPNKEKQLRPGLLMSIELLKNPREALVVPEESLMADGRQNYVWVVDTRVEPTRAQKRPVILGARRPGEAEVIEGLAVGETIVTHGTLRIQPNSVVNIMAVQQDNEPLRTLLKQQESTL